MLRGDFSTFNSATCARSVTLRAPFVNNRVDPALISPAALAIAARLPQPQDECGRVQYSRTRPSDESQYIGKVDVQLNNNHTVFGRYMLTRVKVTPPLEVHASNILVATQGGNEQPWHSLTIGDTMVLSNHMVNSLRIAANYTDVHRTHVPIGFDARNVGINIHTYL